MPFYPVDEENARKKPYALSHRILCKVIKDQNQQLYNNKELVQILPNDGLNKN